MKDPIFEEILTQYKFGNKEGNGYSLFEKYSRWFKESLDNGNLKSCLLDSLKEISQNTDLRIYDFVLLVIQAFDIDFTEEDEHFELLFSIADSITEGFTKRIRGDKKSLVLYQLTDICIHYSDQVEFLANNNPKLIEEVVKKIGQVQYEINGYGPYMYFAAYKSIGLIWFLPSKEAKKLLDEIFLEHFDKRVIEEAEETIIFLIEEGRYR